MPDQILHKPDGTWAVFSTVIDDFVLDGVEESEVFEFFVTGAVAYALRTTRCRLDGAVARNRPGESMIPSYDEACATRDFQHFTSTPCRDEEHELCPGTLDGREPCRCPHHRRTA